MIAAVLFVIVCGKSIGSCETIRFAEYASRAECVADVTELRKTPPVPGIVKYWCEPSNPRRRRTP